MKIIGIGGWKHGLLFFIKPITLAGGRRGSGTWEQKELYCSIMSFQCDKWFWSGIYLMNSYSQWDPAMAGVYVITEPCGLTSSFSALVIYLCNLSRWGACSCGFLARTGYVQLVTQSHCHSLTQWLTASASPFEFLRNSELIKYDDMYLVSIFSAEH